MTKRIKLTKALHDEAGTKNRFSVEDIIINESSREIEAKPVINSNIQKKASVNKENVKEYYVAPSRVGKKSIGSQFDPKVSKQLRRIAIDRDTTVHGLLTEALNDLFEKYNLKPIA